MYVLHKIMLCYINYTYRKKQYVGGMDLEHTPLLKRWPLY
jgi:hypothetical protein